MGGTASFTSVLDRPSASTLCRADISAQTHPSPLRTPRSLCRKPTAEIVCCLSVMSPDPQEMNKEFFCDICNKQYKNVGEMSNHLSSYDHHHVKVSIPKWHVILHFYVLYPVRGGD